jgi:hypothetical protein
MSEEELEPLIRRLPYVLLSIPREMKVALVKNRYTDLESFPISAESLDWNILKSECGFMNAECNRLKRAIFQPKEPSKSLLNKSLYLYCSFNW